MQRVTLLLAGLATLVVAFGPVVWGEEPQAQTQGTRVAVWVQVTTPPGVDAERVAHTVFESVARALKSAERIELIAPERTREAIHRLHIGREPTPREIRALARALHADRIVILNVSIRDRFRVSMRAVVFQADGHVLVEIRVTAFADQLSRALERAVRTLMESLIPALLRR